MYGSAGWACYWWTSDWGLVTGKINSQSLVTSPPVTYNIPEEWEDKNVSFLHGNQPERTAS